MRRDRTGEPVEPDGPTDAGCEGGGWITREPPAPCPACRPWLVRPHPRPPTPHELAAARGRRCPGTGQLAEPHRRTA